MKKTIGHKTLWINIVLVVIAILILILLFQTKTTSNKHIKITNGTVLAPPYDLKQFSLIDQNGKMFTNGDLKRHWSMLFFGFTRCPMMCPTTLAELNKAYHHLQKEGNYEYLPRVIFVSVDPKYDTPVVIKKYLKAFNPNFIGLTGTQLQINDLTKQLGIAYAKVINSGESDYTINHTGAILIINPDGKWRALINLPHEATTITEDFRLVQKNS